jgi:hypothetical protein
MKTILSNLGPWLFVGCVALGLGVSWRKTNASPKMEAPEPPMTIVVRQADVEPTALYLRRAKSPGRWYSLPPGYVIVSKIEGSSQTMEDSRQQTEDSSQ